MRKSIGQDIQKLIGTAISRFGMIRPGDRLAVGISGGKDSLTMLDMLLKLQRKAPVRFDLAAFTIQQGKFLTPIEVLETHLKDRGVPWLLLEDPPSLRLVRNQVDHGCDVCSRFRRRAVYLAAQRLGANVIALGHTADDFAEALLRNILFTGSAKPLLVHAESKQGEFRLIRPMILVTEDRIEEYARSGALPIVPCSCSLKTDTARGHVRSFVRRLAAENPHVMTNVLATGMKLLAGRSRAKAMVSEDF